MKNVSSLIPPSVLRQVSQLRQLEAQIRQVLPEAAASRVNLLRLEAGVCILSSPDTVWATNLRFYEPQIQSIVAEKTGQENVRVKVVCEKKAGLAAGYPKKAQISETLNSANRKRFKAVLKKL